MSVCELCESAPADGDDPFCALCRIEVTAMSMTIHDPVELALGAHWHFCPLSNMDQTMCRCGKIFDGGPANHRRHVAKMIRAALGLDPPAPWTPASDEVAS